MMNVEVVAVVVGTMLLVGAQGTVIGAVDCCSVMCCCFAGMEMLVVVAGFLKEADCSCLLLFLVCDCFAGCKNGPLGCFDQDCFRSAYGL